MSTKIADLFDLALLGEMIDGGYVRRQEHPALSLSILNYSERCQYERVWNPVTRTCRGLIFDRHTNEVAARPFPKFFNHGEPESATLDLAGPVTVTDKADGSLGILYDDGDGGAIATRGSFMSDQARHATAVWKSRYADRFAHWLFGGHTALFEIVYPGNRIVLDYGDLDDLILLGAVHVESGRSVSAAEWDTCWPNAIDEFPYATFAQALAAPPRPGREGLVVHLRDSDTRVKIKQEDYVALHRIVTGLNARAVWAHLAAGGTVDALCANLPDEFHPWVVEVAATLWREVSAAAKDIEQVYDATLDALPEGWGRKDYALRVKDHRHRAALFLRVDGRDYMPLLWRQVEPAGDWRPTSAPSEDVA